MGPSQRAADDSGVASLNLSPRADTLESVGDTTKLTIEPTDEEGESTECSSVTWESRQPSVADVDGSGRVVGRGAGETFVDVRACGLEESARIRVAQGGGSGSSGGSGGSSPPPPGSDPELPRAIPDTARPALTDTVRVSAGGNLQAALDAADAGTLILLQPGATYRGQLDLKDRGDAGWVVIRTDVQLPSGRVDTTANLATLTAGGGNPRVLEAVPGASGWRIEGVEITLDPGASYNNAPVYFHSSGTDVPSRIVLDRVYVHPAGPDQNVKRCVLGNAAGLAILRSVLSDCTDANGQAQGIAIWNSPGPFLVEDNYISGGSQAVIFGGADPADASTIPADATLRRNHLHWPDRFRGSFHSVATLELKNVRRALVEENVIDGGDFGFLAKSVNQNGGCPSCGTSHVTFRRNVIRNTAGGINLARMPETHPADPMHDVLVEDVVIDSIGPAAGYSYGGAGKHVQLLEAPDGLTLRGITMRVDPGPGRPHTWLILGGAVPSPKPQRFVARDILVTDLTRWGLHFDNGSVVGDYYQNVGWSNIWTMDQCGAMSCSHTSQAPADAGADESALRGMVAKVVQ